MRIAEIFQSIQGEGLYTGTPSIFVRTTGCNLRCWFCDTPYTSWQPEGEQHSLSDILNRILAIECHHVVLTGGEPLLQRDIVSLSREIRAAGRFVTIETAATVARPVAADLMSISPKMTNSMPRESGRWRQRHELRRHSKEAVLQLIEGRDYQFKFVIDQPDDLDEVVKYLATIPQIASNRVWLMPQGVSQHELSARENWLIPLAKSYGFQTSSRKHIELFGHTRGT